MPRPRAAFDPSAFRPLRIDEDYDVVDDSPGAEPTIAPAPVPADPSAPTPVAAATSPDTGTPSPELPEPGSRSGTEAPRPGPAPTYPIPPAYPQPVPPPFPAEPAVPTWAHREPARPRPNGVTTFADYTIDPMSLRRRATIRAGASALSVDESKLVLRSWLKRTEIPWTEVEGFEPRFDSGPANGTGRLVALTRSGPRDLPATKRDLADLRYLAALLDAYRQRATIAANR
jgi:hypothetical protein